MTGLIGLSVMPNSCVRDRLTGNNAISSGWDVFKHSCRIWVWRFKIIWRWLTGIFTCICAGTLCRVGKYYLHKFTRGDRNPILLFKMDAPRPVLRRLTSMKERVQDSVLEHRNQLLDLLSRYQIFPIFSTLTSTLDVS